MASQAGKKSDKKAAKRVTAELVPAVPVATVPEQVAERPGGADLWYGEPVRHGKRTIVPVARVRVGADGGQVRADPAGFLEIGPKGTTYTAIADRSVRARLIGLAAAAVIGAGGAVVGARLGRSGRRTGPLRRRGR